MIGVAIVCCECINGEMRVFVYGVQHYRVRLCKRDVRFLFHALTDINKVAVSEMPSDELLKVNLNQIIYQIYIITMHVSHSYLTM